MLCANATALVLLYFSPPSSSLWQLLNDMSIPETDRTSNLDSGQDGAIVRQDAEAESQGVGGGGEHQYNPAEQEVEPNEAAGGQEQNEAPTSARPPSANAASAKKIFGTMRRSNPTVKKGVQNASYSRSYLMRCQIGYDAYNYEEKYPDDAIYEETTSNARVWRVHEDESRNHDATWSKNPGITLMYYLSS